MKLDAHKQNRIHLTRSDTCNNAVSGSSMTRNRSPRIEWTCYWKGYSNDPKEYFQVAQHV